MQSKKSNPQGATSANTQKTPVFKQWWFWLAIVAVAAVAGCLCSILLKNAGTKPDSTPSTLDTALTNTYITCHVGETFHANGMDITYLGAEKWLPAGETEHPKDDYIFLRVKIAAENKSTENREIYDDEFTCIADGGRQVLEYFTNERLRSGVVAPGERVEGYIYFTIPVGASTIEIEYTSYLYWRNHIAVLPVNLAE